MDYIYCNANILFQTQKIKYSSKNWWNHLFTSFEYDYAIVNGIYLNDLHNETGSVNVNGLTIEIAKLIKKNYISVSIDDDVIDKEEKITLVLNHMNIKKLNSTDKEIINILQLFSKHDMTLKDIKTKLNNKSVLKKFIFQLKIWKRDIEQKNRINPMNITVMNMLAMWK